VSHALSAEDRRLLDNSVTQYQPPSDMLHWYNLLEFVLSCYVASVYAAKIALSGEDAKWLVTKLPPSVCGWFM
jgi:hypothetical protein